jgi:uncharacterized membrane protein
LSAALVVRVDAMAESAPLPPPVPAGGARPGRPSFAGVLVVAASVAYPLIVYFALGRVGPRWIALGLGGLALARAAVARERFWLVVAIAAALLAAASVWVDGWVPLKLYPVVVNLALLGAFAASLRRGPSAIERLARLREPGLPPSGVAYTRRVTQVWCVFFAANAVVSAATALWADAAGWALYNGLVAYVAMGVLMAGEWLVRRRVRARAPELAQGAIDG